MTTDDGSAIEHEDFLVLTEDEDPDRSSLDRAEPWRVLIVDDDRTIHDATRFALRDFRFAGRGLEFLNAYSAAEAKEVLVCNPGIACVLLDVVMEYESAGLDLVGYIRDELKDSEIRLILRTGQPGYAPEIRVIQDYDINDYKEKSYTTGEQLLTSVAAALRSYQQIRMIDEHRRGLERVIAASARLLTTQELDEFAAGILTQVAALVHTLPDGLVCVVVPPDEAGKPPRLQVRAAAGSFVSQSVAVLDRPVQQELAADVAEVQRTRRSVFQQRISLLYVPPTRLGEVVVVIRSMAPIPELERKLLELFCINIAVGLDNSVMFQKIENLAFVDPLTGLPNAFTLLRHIGDALDPARPWLLGLADVDNFEQVNDGLGRETGDYLLRHVGNELRAMPEIGFVARAGGDVFGFLLPADAGQSPGEQLQRIGARLKRTLQIRNAVVALGVTVGAATFRPGTIDASAVIANAGIALKLAKQSRPGGFLLFEDGMNAALRTRLHLTARMHKAIEDKAFFLLYQPQLSLLSGQVIGVEALIRWRDGNQVVPPDQFIAVAESSGLILPLGQWVLDAALAQQRKWREQGWRVRMAVNVSTRQIVEDERFVEFVRESIATHGGDPAELELEVTESMVINDMASGIGRLRELQAMGVQIAIDDFGTGYSSLGQLRHLPVNRLKIDRVFIQGLDRDPDDFHIAELIVRMGHAIRLSVLAEGVETAAQRDILEDLNCDEVQGYLYARPLSPDDLPALFERLGVSAPDRPLAA